MYRREQCYQLLFEDVCPPLGGKLSGDNRWIKLAELLHRSGQLYIKTLY